VKWLWHLLWLAGAWAAVSSLWLVGVAEERRGGTSRAAGASWGVSRPPEEGSAGSSAAGRAKGFLKSAW
jgi:hypothetical protein